MLWDHRDQLVDEAAVRRPIPPAAARRSRAAGAEVFLPRLETHLGGLILPRQEVVGAHRDSALRGGIPPRPNGIPWCYSRSAPGASPGARQRGDGVIPLVRFVRLISDQVGGEPASGLRAWIDETLNRIALDANDEAWAKEVHGSRGEDLIPARTSRTTCWCRSPPGSARRGDTASRPGCSGPASRPASRPGEEKVALDDLPACLGALLEELLDRRRDGPDLGRAAAAARAALRRRRPVAGRLDFIDGIPLGVEHRLIVRSLERSSRSRAVQALLDRWRAVRRRLRGPLPAGRRRARDEGRRASPSGSSGRTAAGRPSTRP